MNPIYLSIPVFIAATLAFACAALFSIIHRKDAELNAAKLYNNQATKDLLTERARHKDVVDKLESDLKEADKDFDLKSKSCQRLAMEVGILQHQLSQANARTFTGRKRNNKGQFVVVAKDVEP